MRPEWLWVVLFYPASGVVEEEEAISAHSAESMQYGLVLVGESRSLEGRRKHRRRKNPRASATKNDGLICM